MESKDNLNNPDGQIYRNRLRIVDAYTGVPYPVNTEQLKMLVNLTERIFAPFIGLDNVVLGILKGRSNPPTKMDNRIRITIWKHPWRSSRDIEFKPRNWVGRATDTAKPVTIMSPLGGTAKEIRYAPEGPAIAQVFHRHIHVLANVLDAPSEVGLQLFEWILSEGLEHFIANGDVTVEMMSRPCFGTSNDNILTSLTYVNSNHAKDLCAEIARLDTELRNVKKLIDTESHQILRSAHMAGNNEHYLKTEGIFEGLLLEKSSEHSSVACAPFEQLRGEFDLIVTHPLVRYLPHHSSNSLTVYSRHIYVVHRENNDLHDMGFYRVLVPICAPSDYRWYNLTRRVQGFSAERQHPHIYAEGYGCLGNAKDMMTQALDSGDFYGMVNLGLRFLTSCQVRDLAGKYLVNWPKIPKLPE